MLEGYREMLEEKAEGWRVFGKEIMDKLVACSKEKNRVAGELANYAAQALLYESNFRLNSVKLQLCERRFAIMQEHAVAVQKLVH